jgi:FkbM family methyltransferase
MTKINVSYGEVDTGVMVAQINKVSKIYPPQFPWDKLAVEWPELTSDSVVVDVGGYTGTWSLRMSEFYNPKLFVFEPQEWCCIILKELLSGKNATVYQFALGTTTGSFPVYSSYNDYYENDGCSFVEFLDKGRNRTNMKATLPMREIGKEFKDIGLNHIDLMHMNIEGGEYELVPYMFKQNIFPEIFLLQSHSELLDRAGTLTKYLSKYYTVIWDYGTVALSAYRLK